MKREPGTREWVLAALEHELILAVEVEADVGAVDFFLNDQRIIGQKAQRFGAPQVLVVRSARRTEQVRSARVFDEIAVGCAHVMLVSNRRAT